MADADKNLIFATGSQKSGRKESILEEKGRSAGPEGERGVSTLPLTLWTPLSPQRKRGCSPLLTLKKWAALEKTEDSRLFGVKIF